MTTLCILITSIAVLIAAVWLLAKLLVWIADDDDWSE